MGRNHRSVSFVLSVLVAVSWPVVVYREDIEIRFFEAVLEEDGETGLPEALVFETGANAWREYERWPPAGLVTTSLYLQAEGGLSFEPPVSASGVPGFDEFLSDRLSTHGSRSASTRVLL